MLGRTRSVTLTVSRQHSRIKCATMWGMTKYGGSAVRFKNHVFASHIYTHIYICAPVEISLSRTGQRPSTGPGQPGPARGVENLNFRILAQTHLRTPRGVHLDHFWTNSKFSFFDRPPHVYTPPPHLRRCIPPLYTLIGP